MTERVVDIGMATRVSAGRQYYFDKLGRTGAFRSKLRPQDAFLVQKQAWRRVPMESRSLFSWDTQCSQKIKSRICRCGYLLSLAWLPLVVSIPFALRSLISRKWSH